MYHISGEIEFIADHLQNRLTEAEKEKIDKGTTGGKKNMEEKLAEAHAKAHRNGHGIMIPAWNFKQCLLGGVVMAGLKVGKKSAKDFISATVFPVDDLLFHKDEPDYIHEKEGKIPPKTGGMAIIRRPAMRAGSKLEFKLMVTDDRRDPGQIHTALVEAGIMVGLGGWRPHYGRFKVTKWQVEKPEKAAPSNGAMKGVKAKKSRA